MKKISSILWGLVFVVLGVIVALNALEITSINIFFDGWWTLFIIVPSFINLFKDNDKTGNIISLLIGIVLLLCAQGFLDFGLIWKLILPIIIIVFGLKMIFSGFKSEKSDKILENIKSTGTQFKSRSAVFSGVDLNYNNEKFEGTELNAIFGGVKCDLRNAIIEKDSVINATVVFGGIDILMPTNINVKVNSTSIFGGVDNKLNNSNDNNHPTVYINATCLFGGIDIK